jgi:hypothetical protein
MLDEEEEADLYGSDADEDAFDELEKEAKMLRDESESEQSGAEEDGAGDENAEFLDDG